MLGLIFFAFCVLAVFGLLRLLPLRLTLSDQLAWSVVGGIVLGSWLTMVTSWVFGYSLGVPLAIGLIVGLLLLSYKLPTRMHNLEPELPQAEWARALHGSFIMLLCAFFGYITLTHFFEVRPDGWYSAGYTWSDLALHASIISGVSEQARFTFQMPIYAPGALSYPFLFDFFSGIMIRLGSSWQVALVAPTFLTLLSLFQIFLSLTRRLLNSARAAWIHLGLFVLSGSSFGIYHAYNAIQERGWNVLAEQDFSMYPSKGLTFANIVTSHLLPQRGFLLGFASALLIFQLCRIVYRNEAATKVLVWIIGVLVGLLPFIHVHTFIVTFGLIAILFATDVLKNRSFRSPWAICLSVALAIALPQFSWQYSSNYSDTFGHWFLGWMRKPDESISIFWLKNMGVAFVFLVGNFFIYQKWVRDQLVWQFYFLSVLTFLAVNVRIFQPNDFDNMKFLVYSYWGITMGIAFALAKWSRVWWGALISAVLFLSLTLVGAATLYREVHVSYQEVNTNDLTFVEQYKAIVPTDALVLTTSTHNNVVPVLGGRNIVMGYPGWLWSYGINYTDVENDIREIWWGTARAFEIIHKYGITHVVFNENEVRPYGINQTFMNENFDRDYQGQGWFVYSVR